MVLPIALHKKSGALPMIFAGVSVFEHAVADDQLLAPSAAQSNAQDSSLIEDQQHPCAVVGSDQREHKAHILVCQHTIMTAHQQHVSLSRHQQRKVPSCTRTGQQLLQSIDHKEGCDHQARSRSNSSSGSAAGSLLSVSLATMGCMPVPGYQPIGDADHLKQEGQHNLCQMTTGDCVNTGNLMCDDNSSDRDTEAEAVNLNTQQHFIFDSRASSTGNLSNGCSTDDDSTASSCEDLVDVLQMDCKRQAEQLRWKDQQLNEMMLRHQQLLRELLEVKAANQALLLEQQMQHSREEQSDQMIPATAQWQQQQQQLQDWQQLQSLPMQACLIQQPLIIQQQQQNLTPLCTPKSAVAGQGGPWRTVQLPLGSAYLPTPPSPGAPTLLSPAPPMETVQSRRPLLRRHRTWNSLQQLAQPASSPIAAAELHRQCLTGTAVAGTSNSILGNAGVQASNIASVGCSASRDTTELSMAELAAAVVKASAGVSVSVSRRSSSSQSSSVAAPCETTLCSVSCSSRMSEAAADPHLRFQLRSLKASPTVTQQQAAKFAPAPPRDGPLAEGGRAARLRNMAKKDSPLQSSPVSLSQEYRLAGDPHTTFRMRPARSVVNNAMLGRRVLSLDGNIARRGLHRGRSTSDVRASAAASFDAAVEKHSSMLKP